MTKQEVYDKIENLALNVVSEATANGIGEEWLSACDEVFADDSCYQYSEAGQPEFVPSTLKFDIASDALAKLLTLADYFDGYGDTRWIPCHKDFTISILYYLNQGAAFGDMYADKILHERVELKG